MMQFLTSGLALKQGYGQAGFIVYFREGISAQDEVQRLAGLYEFEVILVYSDPSGFAATMSRFTMESLRCETSVESVFYNGPTGG